MIWAYKQFFEEKSNWSAIWKTVASILSSAIIIGVLSGFGGFLMALLGDKTALLKAVTGGA